MPELNLEIPPISSTCHFYLIPSLLPYLMLQSWIPDVGLGEFRTLHAVSRRHDLERFVCKHFSKYWIYLLMSAHQRLSVLCSLKISINFCQFPCARRVSLMVCVTGAGAGTAKPSSQKNAKACKTAWDVRRIPSVRCTLCWAFFVVQDALTWTGCHCQHAQILHITQSLAITKNTACQKC